MQSSMTSLFIVLLGYLSLRLLALVSVSQFCTRRKYHVFSRTYCSNRLLNRKSHGFFLNESVIRVVLAAHLVPESIIDRHHCVLPVHRPEETLIACAIMFPRPSFLPLRLIPLQNSMVTFFLIQWFRLASQRRDSVKKTLGL